MIKALRHLALVGIVSAPLLAQQVAPGVTVALPDGTRRTLAPAVLAALPRVAGQVAFHEKLVRFEGVDLREVLRSAGVTPVDSLRGPQLRRIVVFVGADGYGAAIALSDLDVSIGGRLAVLVDREDGAALPENLGPYRIVIVGDKRPSRWVRQVVTLEVRDLP